MNCVYVLDFCVCLGVGGWFRVHFWCRKMKGIGDHGDELGDYIGSGCLHILIPPPPFLTLVS